MNKFNVISVLLIASSFASAQNFPASTEKKNENSDAKINQDVQKVEITGSQNSQDASRDFVAGKLIIGRQQIVESGLQNVGDLLKREPAVTVGKDGRVGLIGLAGYTQIVFNGEQASGKSPLEMDLSEIERIEIIKTSTAQTGPFGIAGTINVIGKKIERQTFQQVSAGLQSSAGQYGVNGAWSMNHASPTGPSSWNVNLNSSRKPSRSTQNIRQVNSSNLFFAQNEFTGASVNNSTTEMASVSSNFTYRLNTHDHLTLSPSLGLVKMPSSSQEQRVYKSGSLWDITNHAERDLQTSGGRLFWKHVSQDESNLKLTLSFSENKMKNRVRSEIRVNELPFDVQTSDTQSDSWFQGLILEHERSFDGGHEVSMGMRWNKQRLDSKYAAVRNGEVDSFLDIFGQDSRVTEEARRVYIQEDWRINRQWAINTGVSGEERLYEMVEASHFSVSKFQVWSPSFHLARRIQGDSKRQLRFSIARNFRAPESNDLMLRPSINYHAPCNSYSACSKNSLDSADRMGNPDLQAERAWALNASYEQGLGEDSKVTFEVYGRVIDNKIGEEISLQTALWSAQPRYVIRPVNLGSAEVVGASIDWKISLRDWLKTAPKIEVKGSLSRAHSRVSDLPGPYNRLDGQLPWRAKLGMTYVAAELPLRFNFDVNCLPSDWIRNNQTQLSYESKVTTLSSNLVWTPNKTTSISLDINNFLAHKRLGIKEYQKSESTIRRSIERSNYTQVSMRLEMKL